MPVLSFARFTATVLSLLVLAAGLYLLWTGLQGRWLVGADGDFVRVREDWRLWAAAGLLGWSFLGRLIIPLLLARPGKWPSPSTPHAADDVQGQSGSTLRVKRYGRPGAPILLMTHGWGMDSSFWDYARADLADRFELVLWDLPGLGRSKPSPRGEISLSNFAADLSGLIEGMGRPVTLVGHSIGGMIIQVLAQERPDVLTRVNGVVLLNTTYTNPLHTMVFSSLCLALQKPVVEPATHLAIWLQPLVWASKWQSHLSGWTHLAMRLGFGKSPSRAQLNHAALLATKAPPAIEAKGTLAMLRWSGTPLGALQCRTLVVGGNRDIVTKQEASERIADRAPAATLLVIPGANHLGPIEQAELYNNAIGEFALLVQQPVSRDTSPSDRSDGASLDRPDERPFA